MPLAVTGQRRILLFSGYTWKKNAVLLRNASSGQQFAELMTVLDRNGSPPKGYNSFFFKIFKHPGYYLSGCTQILGNLFMGGGNDIRV